MTRKHPFRAPLTQSLVKQCVEGVGASLAEEFQRVLVIASKDEAVKRLELIVHAWEAALRFPMVSLVYGYDGAALESELGWSRLLDGHGPLLPATYADLPIGRIDVAGADFTPEASWIETELIASIRTAWGEIGSRCRPELDVLVGTAYMGIGPSEPDQFHLLNLRTGAWETFERLENP
jgi:hypothetical protein